jgi:hypothetical protein
MDSFARLLLRFLVVPLGVLAAITIAVLVVMVGEWHAIMTEIAAQPQTREANFIALMMLSPWIALTLSGATLMMLAPGAVGILIAEAFAIRAWWFHIADGIVSAWVGWTLLVDKPGEEYKLFTDPKIVIMAGLGAGLAYWLIAGWSAGFMKPVFARAQPVLSTPPPAQKETSP